jgi:hypothetical protein
VISERPVISNLSEQDATVTSASARRSRSMGEVASISSKPSASRMSTVVAMIEGEMVYFFAFLVLEDFFVSFLVEEDLESDDLLESEDLPESEDLDESEELESLSLDPSFFSPPLLFL